MADRNQSLLRVFGVLARVAAVVVLLAVGSVVFWLLRESKVDPTPVSAEVSAIPVRAIEATALPLRRTYSGFGTARAMDAAVVSAQIAARVLERPETVEPGVAVERGSLLIRLDAADVANRVEASRQRILAVDAQLSALDTEQQRLGTQLDLAQQEADVAQRDLERIQQAADAGSGTAADIDQRLAALRRAERTLDAIRQSVELLPARRLQLEADRSNLQAQLRLDEENLSRTEIRAPISGVLQRVMMEPGEYVRVGDEIARIVSPRRIEVPLRLPLSALPWIAGKLGIEAEIVAEDGTGRAWTGTLTRIAPEANEASRTITVFIEVVQPADTPPGELLSPGQFVRGRLSVDDGLRRVAVPRRAVIGDRVLVAEPDGSGGWRVAARAVSVGHYLEGNLPLVEPGETQWAALEPGAAGGVLPGTTVVVSNLDSLRGGEFIVPTLPTGEAADMEGDAP
ncbi:MAG: HlyD family efflux transporter periplasmic adaptor subunit [Planctomycetota bacterium]